MRKNWFVAHLVNQNHRLIREVKAHQYRAEAKEMPMPTDIEICQVQSKIGGHVRKLEQAYRNQPNRLRQAEIVLSALNLREELKQLWKALKLSNSDEPSIVATVLSGNITDLQEFCMEVLQAADTEFGRAFGDLEYIA